MPYPPNVNVAASPLAPIPPTYAMATDEERTLPFNFAPNLGVGETLVSAVSHLIDKSVARGQPITIPSPTVSSPAVDKLLNGNLLSVGHVYWLRITATTSLSNIWTTILTINCLA